MMVSTSRGPSVLRRAGKGDLEATSFESSVDIELAAVRLRALTAKTRRAQPTSTEIDTLIGVRF